MILTVTLTPPMSGAAAVTLHGNGQTNRNLARVQGLVGPPAPRDVVRPRSQTDGVIDDTKFLTERTITLEGEIWNSTGGAAISDLSTVSEAFTSSLLSPAKLTVTYENGTTRFCYVKLSGSVDVSVEGASRLVQYQVQLRAADPRWYDINQQSTVLTFSASGSAATATGTAVSAGTAPSPATMTIVSTSSGSTVYVSEIAVQPASTYRTLIPQTFTSTLLSSLNPSMSIVGSPFQVAFALPRTIDSSTRSATSLDGITRSSEFPYFYPGTSSVGIAYTGGAGTCTFQWYDAFM